MLANLQEPIIVNAISHIKYKYLNVKKQ